MSKDASLVAGKQYRAVVTGAENKESRAGNLMTMLTLKVDPDGVAASMRVPLMWQQSRAKALFARHRALDLATWFRDIENTYDTGGWPQAVDQLPDTGGYLGTEVYVTLRPEERDGKPTRFFEVDRMFPASEAASTVRNDDDIPF